MKIQFEGAVGIPGLIEDISPSYVSPQAVISLVTQQIGRIQGNPKAGTYEQLYRTFGKHLRFITRTDCVFAESAQKLLRRLPLLQTLPFGELEAPDYIDSYTGASLERLDQIVPEERCPGACPELDLLDAVEEMEVHDLHLSLATAPDWNTWLVQRNPYENDDDNAEFIRANISWPGLETEPELTLDDRGHVPPSFSTEGRTDKDLKKVFAECADTASALRKRIGEAVDFFAGTSIPYWKIPAAIREEVQCSQAGIDFLQQLQELLSDFANPANVATIFLRFQHGYGFDIEDASTVLLPDGGTLFDYIDTFEEELLSGVEACGPIDNESISDADIEVEIDALFKEYINNIEEKPINPRHSRAWVLGFIQAVNAGTPLRQIDKKTRTASDAAWDAWRRHTSPEGNTAYRTALRHGATRKVAMRCFYGEARKRGQLRPARPKKIRAIRQHGLVLTNSKFVSWRIAGRINEEEGFDMKPTDRARLKSILVDKGWGSTFAEVL